MDLLVANDVAEAGSGFGTDTNRVTIYAPDAEPDPWPLLSKREVADRACWIAWRRARWTTATPPRRLARAAPASAGSPQEAHA